MVYYRLSEFQYYRKIRVYRNDTTIKNNHMTKKIKLTPEDQALFRSEMQQVTPLKTKKPKMLSERLNSSPLPTRKNRISLPLQPVLIEQWDLSDSYASPVQAESILIYHQSGLGNNQIQALRTGTVTYQAKLDLHGLKPEAAKEQLCRFLQHQIHQHHRWVLIIHGKGGRFGEAPVLKNLVNHWLRQIPAVLAFHSAHSKHGGTGAVYILLKK